MRVASFVGRAMLAAVGLVLLTAPATELWRATTSPHPVALEMQSSGGTECHTLDEANTARACAERFTPLGILGTLWLGIAGGLALVAAALARGDPAVAAGALTGFAWIPLIAEDLRVRAHGSTEGMWGALVHDPGMVAAAATLAMIAAIFGLMLVVGSVPLRRLRRAA